MIGGGGGGNKIAPWQAPVKMFLDFLSGSGLIFTAALFSGLRVQEFSRVVTEGALNSSATDLAEIML